MLDPLDPLNIAHYRNDFNNPMAGPFDRAVLLQAMIEHNLPAYLTVNQLVDNNNKPIEGTGIWDTLKSWAKKVPDWLGKASKFYGSDVATTLKNFLPDTQAEPGEKHAILMVNGKPTMANWAGPGTAVMKRLKRGDKAKSYVDNIAKAHDIRYAIASSEKDTAKRAKKIREADNKMLNALNQAGENKKDSTFNITAAKALMTGKVLAEEAGLLDKDAFGGFNALNAEDLDLAGKNLANLEMEGLGASPAEKLRELAASLHLSLSPSFARREKQSSEREREGKGVRRSGEGVRQSGGASLQLQLPQIFKYAGKILGNRPQLEAKLLRKWDSDAQLGRNVSKEILPTMLSGAGMPKEVIEQIPSKLFKKFKTLLAETSKITGSGISSKKERSLIIKGSGFWDSLKKFGKDAWSGFKYGWNKTKDILSKLPIEKIPVIGETAKKVLDILPNIPGAATTLDELKRETRGNGAKKNKDRAFSQQLREAMKILKISN